MVTRRLQKHYKGMKRKAFSMIELIFAIVILSIGILSLPTILLQDASSQEASLIEEAILIASTKSAQVLSYSWDVNSNPAAGLKTASGALDIPGVAVGNPYRRVITPAVGATPALATDFRVGHFSNEGMRRRMTPSTAPRNALAPALANPKTSISDFDTESLNTALPSAGGNKVQYTYTTIVDYVPEATVVAASAINGFVFANAGNNVPTNLKRIQVTVLDTATGLDGVTLTSYSANIGEAEFFKRRY